MLFPVVLILMFCFTNKKSFNKKAIKAPRPVHTLLVGPPGVAKSLFLLELSRLPRSMFVVGGTSTKVGLRDLLVERRPRFLLIDEIEKMGKDDRYHMLEALEQQSYHKDFELFR